MITGAKKLPAGWSLAQLQTIAHINPTIDKSAYPDHLAVSFVPMPAMEAATGIVDVSTTRRFGEVKKGFTPFVENDVLFAKITPCMENGKMAVVPAVKNGLGFGSTEFHVLRPRHGISPMYVYYFISSQTFRRQAQHKMTGAVGQRRVPTAFISEQQIPIPPSREQTRIVARLDTLFSDIQSGVTKLTSVREQLNTYRQAVLKHAFDGKLQHAGSQPWSRERLGKLASLITSGSRGWAAHYSSSGDLFIRAQNLKRDRLILDDIAYVRLPQSNTAEGMRTRVQVGDVLITITGANVTKTGLVEHELGTAYVNQHVALVRPIDAILPEFLYWYLIAEAGGRRQLNDLAYGAGKPGLNLDNIKSVLVPLPALAVQRDVVNGIRRLLSIADKISCEVDESLEKVDALRESVLKRAFAGELVDQDPTDEPASTLLGRLKMNIGELSGSVKKTPKGKHAA